MSTFIFADHASDSSKLDAGKFNCQATETFQEAIEIISSLINDQELAERLAEADTDQAIKELVDYDYDIVEINIQYSPSFTDIQLKDAFLCKQVATYCRTARTFPHRTTPYYRPLLQNIKPIIYPIYIVSQERVEDGTVTRASAINALQKKETVCIHTWDSGPKLFYSEDKLTRAWLHQFSN